MKKGPFLPVLLTIFTLISLSMLSVSCIGGQQTTQSDFYNAGAADLSITGTQFDQYQVFRFDTSTAGHTLALPSAADIVNNLSNPYAGEVLTFAVAADGGNPVTLIA